MLIYKYISTYIYLYIYTHTCICVQSSMKSTWCLGETWRNLEGGEEVDVVASGHVLRER